MFFASILVIHLIGLVGYTIFLRKSALNNINKYLLAAVMQTGIFLPVIPLIFFDKSFTFDFELWQWLSLILSAFFVVGLHLTNIMALQRLEASVFTIIYNLRLFLTTIFGFIFLHELPSELQIAGGVIIFLSILVLNLHKNSQYRSVPVLFGLLTTIWFSAHATLEKFNVTQVGFVNFMFWVMGMAVVILWLKVFYSQLINKNIAKTLLRDKQVTKLVVLRTASAWGYTFALQLGPLAVVNYVSGLSVSLIVLLGIVVLGEKDNLKQKITAVILASLGIVLIVLGKS